MRETGEWLSRRGKEESDEAGNIVEEECKWEGDGFGEDEGGDWIGLRGKAE